MSAEMECEPSKRRMEDNTTNSEAMTETIAENPNANLSLDSLAQSFVDKVEEQTEDQPESEAQPDPLIESVEAEADEDQEGEVLSQAEDDEDSEIEDDAGQPKGLKKALKQISRLTARAKGAEEEVATLKSQIDSLKSQSTEQVDQKPALENIQNLNDLDSLRKEALAAKKWAMMHLGKEYHEEGDREYSGDDIRAIFTEAEEHLTEKIPQRANFLQQKQAWQNDTSKVFPYISEGDGADYEMYLQVRNAEQYKSILDGLPNGDFLAATIVEGMKSIKGRQEKKPKAKAKTPPPSFDAGDAVAPPVENKTAREQKRKESILGKGNVTVDQFASFLT